MAARKSPKQARFLFSKGSPLTKSQKGKLATEIRTGAVKLKGSRKSRNKSSKGRKRKR